MHRKFSAFAHGYVLVALRGYSPERFLNLCQLNFMELWGLTYRKDHYEFYMTLKDFKSCRAFVRKSKTRLRIVRRFGLPFFLSQYWKRKLCLAGILCCMLLVFGMSHFIWDISFEGNRLYTDRLLLEAMSTHQISHGILRDSLNCDQLEQMLRNEFPKITWVSAEIKGTRLKILIRENEELTKPQVIAGEPSSLAAAKPGQIVSILTRSGVPLVKAGDVVEAGQTLVDGALPILDNNGEIASYQYVNADADILAKTEYTYEDILPETITKRAYTGRKETRVFFAFKDFRLVLEGFPKKFQQADLVEDEHQLKLSENFYLPFYFGTICRREYGTYEEKLSKTEAQLVLNNNLNEFLMKLEKKGVQIIEKNVRIETGACAGKASGTIIVIEPIAIQQNVIQQKETENIDEPTGDNH